MNREIENNIVTISGKIVSNFRFNHNNYGEKFYVMDIEVPRFSGVSDVLPVMISERLMDVEQDCYGKLVTITGQFRSYNRHEGKKVFLMLFVFAQEIVFIDEMNEEIYDNQIYLDGFICKEPVYRETPKGREITDILIAVNRLYEKSDYIPCICWGRSARFADGLSVGTRCQIKGRVQSRVYQKKINEVQSEKRVAYEVSVNTLEVIEEA